MEKFDILIDRYRRLADEDLREMQLLADSRLYRGAVSRAYYACYQAMHFLLVQQDVETKTHKQTHVEFRKRYVKDGPYGQHESQLIDMLFKMRQSADYDVQYEINEEQCLQLIDQAKQFVRTVCHLPLEA
jgi:uncharacterized protein (UPF0332 family)